MNNEDFKAEVLRLLTKISNQLDAKEQRPSTVKAKGKKQIKDAEKIALIHEMSKKLGENFLNYFDLTKS